ncbi:Saccharopine dehydrogenase [NADP(+), L-glutamate-forming] [Nakaseomyces glabratus]|nr:Saccharopine dehydrogenase [NADP(+), L-glutamate-forming] [Nakaseomyces glabratus]KTB17097.1 Saccharopine dehydrogenase [NADP(+), L-glutamate-forming] [Nakaseomyces glabratus]
MTKRVLLLGSGFVAQPVIDTLAATEGIEVTVACRTLANAKQLASASGSDAISLDVTDDSALDAALGQHDLVISLIPYTFHPNVVRSAIRLKKDVVTSSYISPALRELEPEINKAGITVMNEIGLDPGIDHLYAVKTIDEVHRAGGKIKSFLSYCGGLPAPEDSDNPLGYKFSWSSRGVLLALRNSAKYWKDGKIETISSEDLMASAKPYFIYPGYAFVCYPNRDSTLFKELYHIPEADTVIRGTLRYQGFPEFVKALVDMGMLKDDKNAIFSSAIPWNDALKQYLGAKSTSREDLVASIDSKTNWKSQEDRDRILSGFAWLGLFSDTKITPRGNALDTLCARLEELMQYEDGERDMVALQHKFGIEWADGTTEVRTSTMIDYGKVGGYSSMAATVGYPVAIATKFVLNGTIKGPGLLAPYSPEINDPIMKELKDKYGLYLKEKTIA